VVLLRSEVENNFVFECLKSFLTLNLITMKFIKPFMMLIIASALFISCKKDSPAPPPPVDLGGTTWKGSALVSSITYNPFTLIFNANGTGTVTFSGYPPFPGTWNKASNSSIVYFFFDESATSKWKGQATLNAANNKLEGGVLTRTAPSVLSGTFTTDKQ
jgi:hypothetical protein